MTSYKKDNEDNIYEDLPDFHLDETIAKLQKSNSNLQKRVTELEDVIVVLNDEIKALQLEKSVLKSENDTLSTNISSLYKTAVAEVNRKDKIINDLRKENLAFLRNRKSVAQQNGSRALSSSSKDQDSRNHPSSVKHDSQPSNNGRNRSRYQNNKQLGTNVRRRSHSNERQKSKSCSPDRCRSHRSIDLRNKLNAKNASKHLSSKLCNVVSPHEIPAVLENSKADEKPSSVDIQEANPLTPLTDGKPTTPAPELSKNIGEKTGNAIPIVPVRKFNTTFNKNLVIVDKSVPNTIYTKRLRKRILDEISKENEASGERLVSESQSSTAADSTKLETVSVVDHASAVKSKQVSSLQSNLSASSKVHKAISDVNGKGDVLSSEKMENHPCQVSVVNAQKIARPNIDVSETNKCENTSKGAVSYVETPLSIKGECNNQTGIRDVGVVPQPICLPSTPKDSAVGPKSLSSCNVTVPSSSSLSLEIKQDVSTSSTVNSSVATCISDDKMPSVSPNLIAVSSQNSLSNGGSLPTPSSLSYGHCFKKFKKDGKTRINPIYIGPRILAEKSKSERRSVNPVRPVLSQYSNLTNQKNFKPPLAAGGANQIKNKTHETSTVDNRIFCLFGKTPEKVEPFVSSNSVGASSDNSLTNFSFLSSSGSPYLEKRNSPETACKSVTAGDEVDTRINPIQQNGIEITPAKIKASESLLSRDEQMASLFGDVSSDSSSEDEGAPEKTDEKKCLETIRGSESPASNVSLTMQPKGEIIQNYLPTTASVSGTSHTDNSAKTTPNISNSSLERKSFEFSRLANLHTPFKSSDSSSLIMFTPAKEILSPIPVTPQGIAERRDSVTQDKSRNSTIEKAEVTLEKSVENSVSPSVPGPSSFPMQPKAEIIQNYLPKSTSTPDSGLTNAKTAENSANSSTGSRSFDLSKIPAMHTPFKSTDSNLLMCTPAQAILSPIPPTPQGILGKTNPISDKSESSDLFKIIKAPNSADPPLIIKGDARGKFEEQALLSEVKIVTDPIKKDFKSLSSEDGNSNLSINSGVVDKKIFLSPSSISTPTMFCTPFKTFSSDSLQNFMRTPARELLSPIPKTPLGSWDIENDRTNSCDVLENNPTKNCVSPKESTCLKDNMTHKSDSDPKSQFLCVPSSALKKEEKLNEFAPKKNDVDLKSDSVPNSQPCVPPTPINEENKREGFTSVSDDVTPSKHNTVENNELLRTLSSPLIKDESKPKDLTLNSRVISKPNIENGKFLCVPSPPLSKRGNKSPSPTNKHFIPCEKSNVKTDCVSKPKSISNQEKSVPSHQLLTPMNTERKPEIKAQSAMAFPNNSINESEISINPSEPVRNLENSKLNSSLARSCAVISEFSPLQSNISGKRTSVCSVSYSTMSEQIQFPKSWAKVRKKVVLLSPVEGAANNAVRNTCDNSNVSLNPAHVAKCDGNLSRQACRPSSSPAATQPPQHSLPREMFNPSVSNINCKRERDAETDRLLKSCNKIGSHNPAPNHRRAVLIPTDVGNNIIKNLHKGTKTRSKNDSHKEAVKGRKRSRSSDKYEKSPKKIRGAMREDEMRSRMRTVSTVSMKRPTDPEQRTRSEVNKKSRSSHRKSVDRNSMNSNRNYYAASSHRLHDRRSRSISRCRLNHSRRSVSRNLGSNYLARAPTNRPSTRPNNEPRPSRNSSSIESTPSTSSSHSESKKENRDIAYPPKILPKPKMTVSESTSKQRAADNSEHRERTTSVNSSLSSVSTSGDLPTRTEPVSFIDWKLVRINLAVLRNRYESIFFSGANKESFHPADPRFKPYLRRSDSSSIENERLGPQASSTPKMIKRKSKNIKLGDSAQVFSPIKTVDSTSSGKA